MDEEKRRKLGEKGKSFVVNNKNKKVQTKKIIELIGEMILK